MENKINFQEKIKEATERGVEKIFDEGLLIKKMSSEKISIKFGIDPTGSSLHLGHGAALLKLKDFQELGHKIILIIGDFTAQAGDSSDKDHMPRPAQEEEIKANTLSYLPQIGKILDLEKTKIYYNNQWLSRLTAKNLFLTAQNFTVQQMIKREKIEDRWEKEDPVCLHEILYPLFQGYDSVAVRADLEIGGKDQWFNSLTGRDVQKFFGQKEQNIMSLKTIDGFDGKKMSAGQENAINIGEDSEKMREMIMSFNDCQILNCLESCTRIPMEKINNFSAEQAKKEAAAEIAKIFAG